jgi:hypothetical protein
MRASARGAVGEGVVRQISVAGFDITSAPVGEGRAHAAIPAGSDDVLVFDGDYVQPLDCNVAGFFNTAMSCLTVLFAR